MATPLTGLYVDPQTGIEADVNGKQDEAFDDSLITSHSLRKQRGNAFSQWRRNNDGDSQHPVFEDSYKDFLTNIRKIHKQKSSGEENARNRRADDIIDFKFKKRKPSGNNDDTGFAYHDNMESGDFGDAADYEKHLQELAKLETRRKLDIKALNYLQGKKPVRKSVGGKSNPNSNGDRERNILYQNAVPVNVKISGFLEIPLDE